MPDEIDLLQSSNEALASSESALNLIEQKERIQHAVVSKDPALILDTCRAFLESIFKTIIQDISGEEHKNTKFGALFKSLTTSLPMSADAHVSGCLVKISNAIVHNLGELRNKHGGASHGDDGYHVCPVEMNDAYMIVQFVDGLAGFVLKKHKELNNPEFAFRIHYKDYPDFNDFWDEQYDGYELPFSSSEKFIVPASELLFKSDPDAYREALIQFLNDDSDEDE